MEQIIKHEEDSQQKLKLSQQEVASCKYINNQNYYEDYYSDIEISYAASKAHPKSAIQIRNREMVDRADLVICYIEHNEGGAYKTVKYASEQNKPIINLADCLDD